ncbi:MAG: hypothetical protein IJY26_02210, partial [Clostridia bacterium]|nr:hypothetical protein [Clostridia bacterium]
TWENAFPDFETYTLNQNYRNTNQIVEFVRSFIDADMYPIGFDGAPVVSISLREAGTFLKEKKGIKAIIAAEKELPLLKRTAYNVVSETGVLSKKKINLLSVYESKGLEFAAVAVYDKGMSRNEKYIAYTRALDFLAVIREEKKSKKSKKKGKKPSGKSRVKNTERKKKQ